MSALSSNCFLRSPTTAEITSENISEKPSKDLNAKWLTQLVCQQHLYLNCMRSHSPSYRGKELKGNYALSIALCVCVCLQLPRNQLDRGADQRSCMLRILPHVMGSICYSLFLSNFITMHWMVSLLPPHFKNLQEQSLPPSCCNLLLRVPFKGRMTFTLIWWICCQGWLAVCVMHWLLKVITAKECLKIQAWEVCGCFFCCFFCF